MLKNVKKIILLEKLLHNREFVTKKLASKLCGIKGRSFYRYINALSEINIPIYYDKSVHGYRLSNKHLNNINFYTINELVTILLGLNNLHNSVNKDIKTEIEQLSRKIISNSKFNIEDSIEPLNKINNKENHSDKNTDVLIFLLIDIAIKNNYTLKVQYHKQDNSLITTIEQPLLEFNKNWWLKDRLQQNPISLDNIDYIKIF